ncbi:MAG: nucleotidyltransferase domain-containing protein [Nanoarchaeota archaeon]|nr:nucleotidyltransferase domain-containing protein [Nanoarchaeota archaeon]
MLENITQIDMQILTLFSRNYSASYSIRQITQLLKINYSNAFKRIKKLVDDKILSATKSGQANNISLNIQNLDTIKLISFVDVMASKKLKNTNLNQIVKEVIDIDPLSCIGIFGSQVSGKAKKDSDWDIFIISQKDKRRELEKVKSKFPHIKNIEIQVIPIEEFQESLLSKEETVVKHIVKNKQILYNSYPFYNLIRSWEMIKYAPSQRS